MNIVPKLIDNPSWATIGSFSGNELVEFAMFSVLSIALIAGMCWGIYRFVRDMRSR